MAPRKRKTLPKDFEEQLTSRSVEELKAIFDTTELDAQGGYRKSTALAFPGCPDELTRWLVAQGLGVDTPDKDGTSPLTRRAGRRGDNIEILLDLGADIDGDGHFTPLLRAAEAAILDHVVTLVQRGADVHVRGLWLRRNALEVAVSSCSLNNFERAMPVIEYLWSLTEPAPAITGGLFGRFKAQPRPQRVFAMTDELGRIMEHIGHDLWFYAPSREMPETVVTATRQGGKVVEIERPATESDREEMLERVANHEAYSVAVHRLFAVFDLPPVVRPTGHDGISPIDVVDGTWQHQFSDLWDRLVPAGGPAATVQGEVIRIAGRLSDEVLGNGGGNWDNDYRRMLSDLLVHLSSGTPLPTDQLGDAQAAANAIGRAEADEVAIGRLGEWAVSWVKLNPNPVPLPQPTYRR
jgi:hypothetical protein